MCAYVCYRIVRVAHLLLTCNVGQRRTCDGSGCRLRMSPLRATHAIIRGLFVCLFVSQNKIKKHCQIAIHVRLDIFVSNIRNISQMAQSLIGGSGLGTRIPGFSETWNKFFHLTEITNMILSVLIYTVFIRHSAPCYLNPRLFQHVCLSLNISTLCKRPKRTSCLQLCSRYITTPVVCESRKRNRVDDPPGGSSRPVALRCTTPGTGWVPHRHLLRLSSSRLKARIS